MLPLRVSPQASAVAIGGEGEGILVGHQQAAIGSVGGDHALLEEEDIVFFVAEEMMLVEKPRVGDVVDIAGHDVPGDDVAAEGAVGEELFAEDLEEGLISDGGDGVFALGSVVAKRVPWPPATRKAATFPRARRSLPRVRAS